MELWDLYTSDRKPTGLTMVRGEKNPEGLYNLSVTVWIKNNKVNILFHSALPSRRHTHLNGSRWVAA